MATAGRYRRSPSPIGNGKFGWTDENGSEIVWQTVGTFSDGRVWYATGKVKAGPAAPAIPVQSVVIVTHKRRIEKDGVALFAPIVEAYMHSDSKAANLVLRILGPTVPNVAEQAAGQLLDFFSGIAMYVQKNPGKADELLGPTKKAVTRPKSIRKRLHSFTPCSQWSSRGSFSPRERSTRVYLILVLHTVSRLPLN